MLRFTGPDCCLHKDGCVVLTAFEVGINGITRLLWKEQFSVYRSHVCNMHLMPKLKTICKSRKGSSGVWKFYMT